MGRRKRLPDLPFSVAAVPDRSLSLVGAYITFRKRFTVGEVAIARKGSGGIIVRDSKGICKQSQIPIKIHGDPEVYRAVPRRLIDVSRPSR